MNYIEVTNLTKKYETFTLDNASLTLEKGYIMGFIGENGAGKTTFLRSMLNIINKDGGTVKLFGLDMDSHELDIKQDVAFMSGDAMFYPRSKLSKITNAFKSFYKNWDAALYQQYISDFKLDENKRVNELSQGMRIKYSLALALSHKAKLLILDEPTSGLDPVAREMLLDVFQSIIESGEVSILFSTHITSDLDKCADYISYIRDGKIVLQSTKDDLIDAYKIISGSKEQLTEIKPKLISFKQNSFGFTGLIKTEFIDEFLDFTVRKPSLDDIIVYFSTYRGVEHV